MVRFPHPAELLLFVVALVGALDIWLSIESSSSQAAVPPSLSASAAAPTDPTAAAPAPTPSRVRLAASSPSVSAAPATPTGRRNPLVALPGSGTPTLTVRPGQRVELRSSPGGKAVAALGDATEFGSPMVLSVVKRRGNWVAVPSQLLANGELGWVKLDPEALRIGSVDARLVVDLSTMRAKLLVGARVERSFVVGIGDSGTPTPTGRFAITDELPNDFNPAYGCCVLPLTAIQPNVAAGWSGGNRMAIHGTSMALGQANSTGCVHAAESDLRALIDATPLGTPVTIKG